MLIQCFSEYEFGLTPINDINRRYNSDYIIEIAWFFGIFPTKDMQTPPPHF